ncbi:MAG: FFLEELY motif protein [Wenzhouxiangella sp.]
MSKRAAVDHLREQIERNQYIAARIDQLPEAEREALARLQQWQRRRLDATYADLAARPESSRACEFFLDELYGGRNVESRDHQLARVVPVMRRFLPGHLLHAIGEALRLQAVSLEFDLALSERLPLARPLDQPAYAASYRSQGDWGGRQEQIDLIVELGELLDETVKKPMVRQLLRMMQGPAEMAGFGALHGFLQRGMTAFAALNGAEHFLGTIETREREALAAMQAGSDWPFEPWIGHGPAPAPEE